MLGRHPTLWIAIINSVVMMIATFPLGLLNGDQAAAIVVVVNALSAAANAWAVRPLPVPAFTYLLTTIVSLGALFGIDITPEQLGTLNTTMVAILGLLTYGNVSPVDTAISKSTSAQAAPEVQTVPEA